MIPHSSSEDVARLDLNSFQGKARELVVELRENVLSLCRSQRSFKRDDYREFIDLCILYLDDTQPANFRKPGALHKARWLAKVLYILNICMMERQIAALRKGTVTSRQTPK